MRQTQMADRDRQGVGAGPTLRMVREKLGLTMRDVETASHRLARVKNNEEYFVPISRLSDFETRGVIPSIYRLQALATIYRLNAPDILSLYGVNLDPLPTRTDV